MTLHHIFNHKRKKGMNHEMIPQNFGIFVEYSNLKLKSVL